MIDERKRKDSRKEFLFETRARQSRQVRCNFWILYHRIFISEEKPGCFTSETDEFAVFLERLRHISVTLVTYISDADIAISHRRIIFPCAKSLRLTLPDNQHPVTSRKMLRLI